MICKSAKRARRGGRCLSRYGDREEGKGRGLLSTRGGHIGEERGRGLGSVRTRGRARGQEGVRGLRSVRARGGCKGEGRGGGFGPVRTRGAIRGERRDRGVRSVRTRGGARGGEKVQLEKHYFFKLITVSTVVNYTSILSLRIGYNVHHARSGFTKAVETG